MLLLLHSRIHIYYKNHVCIGRPSVLALVLCIASSASSQGIKFDHRHRMPLKPLVQSALLSVLGAAKAEVRPRIKQDGRPTHFRSSLFHAAVKLAGAVVLDGMATTFVLDCSAVRGLHDSALCPRVRVRSSEHFSFLHRDGNNSSGLSRVATYVSIYNAGTCMHLTMHRPTETPDCPHLLPQQHAGSYPAIKFQASTTKCASQSASRNVRVEQSIRTPECDRSGNWRLTQGIEAVMERVRHLLLSSDVFASTAGPAKNFTLKGLQIG